MVTLFFTHRKSRKENQIRLEQYYNEQVRLILLYAAWVGLKSTDCISSIDPVYVARQELSPLPAAKYCENSGDVCRDPY
jgi:hypothetical protein